MHIWMLLSSFSLQQYLMRHQSNLLWSFATLFYFCHSSWYLMWMPDGWIKRKQLISLYSQKYIWDACWQNVMVPLICHIDFSEIHTVTPHTFCFYPLCIAAATWEKEQWEMRWWVDFSEHGRADHGPFGNQLKSMSVLLVLGQVHYHTISHFVT